VVISRKVNKQVYGKIVNLQSIEITVTELMISIFYCPATISWQNNIG